MGDTTEKVEKEMAADKDKLLEEEIEAAFEEEFGKDWLADKPLWFVIFWQFVRFSLVCGALYFFLIALGLMGDAFTALAGKGAGQLFSGVKSPIVGLMIGILATVLVQSSSTTTSIIVVLVGNGLISVVTAIPMIMGANIGTTVTNTLVSLGFADDTDAYRRGFAGATVHDMFNYLNVLLLLPLELVVAGIRQDGGGGLLQSLSEATASGREDGKQLEGGNDYKDANPIKKMTAPILEKLIILNKAVVNDFGQGFPEEPENPLDCELTFKFENKAVKLELCPNDENKPSNKCDFCPDDVFNQTIYDAAKEAFDSAELISGGQFEKLGDYVGGILCLVLSIVMLISALAVIVKTMTAVVKGPAKKILVRSLNYDFVGGGYLSILIGCGITLVVQSSSITTSVLTPLVAVDTLSLENMFPFTLGANIGTTATGLIAAAASGKHDGFVIALVHMYFNIVGTAIWYPAPFMRAIPLSAARFLGEMAGVMKIFPVLYILTAFIFYPLFFFGISAGFRSGNNGGIAAAAFFLAVFLVTHGYVAFWYLRRDGKDKFVKFVEARKQKLLEVKAAKIKELHEKHIQEGQYMQPAASL